MHRFRHCLTHIYLLAEEADQVLISHLESSSSLFAGAPVSAIGPLKVVQNAAALLVLNLPKFTPL